MKEKKIKYYPLTHAQKRIYYDDKLYPGTAVGTQAFIVRYNKILDRGLLEQAINKVIQKNDGFRLRIVEIDYEPQQYVSGYHEQTLDYIEFSGPDSENHMREWVGRNTQVPIEIIDSVLFYFAIIKFNEKESGYYMKFHHVASDGGSYPIIFSEINKIYEELEAGRHIDDEPYPSYLQYVADEQAYLNSEQVIKDKEFWHNTLLPLPQSLNLTPKKGDPSDLKGNVFITVFPGDVRTQMDDYCKTNKTSLFKLIFAAVSIYSARLSGLDDVAVTAVNHNRYHKDPVKRANREKTVGMFVSTLPFRAAVDGNMTFDHVVEKTGNDVINYILKNHQQYPFDRLATELRDASGIDAGHLMDILISAHDNVEKENYSFEHIFQGYVPGSINIHINYNNKYLDGILEIEYEYRVAHYKQSDMERFHNGLVTLLRDALSNPGKKISGIQLLSEEEKKQILYRFNDTEAEFPSDTTLQQLFEAQVEKTPGNTAIVYRENKLTYRELNRKSNQLARSLRKKGITADAIAAVMDRRSTEMIIGIIAILKAGGAYLLLDPGDINEQIHYLLKDSQNKLLLTRERYASTVDFDGEVIDLGDDSLYQGENANLEGVNAPTDLAYVVYTSGLKGESRGVMVEHRSIINTLMALQNKYPSYESDVYLFKTSYQFNVSILELFGWFLGGGRLSILDQEDEKDPQKVLDAIHNGKITHINFVPTMFNQFINILNQENVSKLSGLKYLFLSGEIVLPETINRFKHLKTPVVIENLYGTPETSVYVSSYSLSKWHGGEHIPIGKPLQNTKMYILNFINGKPVLLPMGIPGELCIAGIGLARDYLKKPKLSDKAFINNPFPDKEPYKRLYRTGELARWLPDGNIEYLGRIERKVKIRGTRIEREETENHLLKLPEIKEAVVVARQDTSGIYLCSYIVSDEEIDTSGLREKLSKTLPTHMIPSYFLQIPAIPLTPDGKANRAELLDVKHDPHQIENILAEIEAEVLHLKKDNINLDDNFFELGGQSFKASQVISKIHKAFNVKVSMAELFKRPTLRQLAEYLTESIEVKYASIQPAEPKEYYPQSSAQKRLYFLHEVEEEDTVYNIQMMDIYCKGIEKEKLNEALKALIKRHESLRTSFHLIEGETVQKIHEEVAFKIEYYETTEQGLIYSLDPRPEGSGNHMEGIHFQEVIKNFVRPFDLAKPPLFRVGFIKILGNTKIFMLDMHHIIADGISMEILAKELWELYDDKELPALRLQYKDFCQWLNDENQVEAVKEQEAFWLQEFSGEIPMINLPTDYARPPKLTFDGDTLQFEIGKVETQQLNKIAHDHAESLYMVLFAVCNVLLNKISGQEDIIVGTVTAGRGHTDLENIVGMFLNTLALRNYPEGKKIFEDFLSEIKVNTFAAFENQDYPFDDLVRKTATREDPSRNPLFDVAFGLENEADPTGYLMEVAIPDKSKPYDFGTKKAKFDMTLVAVETESGLECTIEYKTKLFREETVERIAAYFKKIISSVCSDIRQKIGEISIISELEKEQIIYEFNDTKIDYPTDKTIHELFEERIEKKPNNIALTYRGDKLTYREVNEKANQLACILREKGVKPGNMVGIMVERSMEMVIGIMAILKAGGAYLPVDPAYPEDRIRYLFKDSSSKLLLTQEKSLQLARTVEFEGEVMNLNDQSLYRGDTGNPGNVNDPEDLAYIIYTSGSTGKPKGVMIEHVSAVNLLLTLDKMYPIEEPDAYLLKTAFLFDVSVSEIFGWFWRGGKLAILEQGGEKDPLMMIDKIEEEKVTHLNFVPSMFNVFVSMLDNDNIKKLASLRYIFLAGEAIWPESVLKFRSFGTGVVIDNIYGPTEATVYASWYPVAKWKGTGSVSIGVPVDNLKLYILSSDNKARPALQPVGIAGELTISGVQLARGYLNRPDLTSHMFVDNPFAAAEGGDKNFRKLYHTGDLTRWYPDGNIEYMGRIDFQVKVRGYRIELGEIESQLTALDEVKEAIVIVRQDHEGEKYLCAYLMAEEKIDMTSVRKRLFRNIPNYMVPSYFVQIDNIPLNPNGKLDRKALPEPEAEAFATEYAAPTNEMEEILAGAWAEALGTGQVGIDDNFFEVGGDSIKTIMITAKLKKRQLNLSINDFFTYKTIRKLAKHVKKIERKIDQAIVTGDVALTPIHKWFFQKAPEGIHYFNQVVMQHRKEGFDEAIVKKVFEKIAAHHDALRMVYEIDGDKVVQRNRGPGEGELVHLEVVEFESKEHYQRESENQINRINDGIDLKTGPLVKCGLFRIPGEDILMIGIHHNVMDGVSWRILLEDFETGYGQAEKGEEIKFPEKTDSFKEWASRLKEYADSAKALEELDYWKTIEETEIAKLPMGRGAKKETKKYKNQEVVLMNLDKEKSLQLIKEANWLYNTEINDLFLAVLGMSVKEWSGNEKILTNLEGHGREGIIQDIDITRTIGWFTSQYPVLLDMTLPAAPLSPAESLAYQIRNVKETLRQIPHKGIGHGILKYLTSPEKKESISFKLQPEICFNYLGQLEEETGKGEEKLQLNLVLRASGQCDTSYPIDIYGGVEKDGLNLLFNYDKHEFDRDSIEKLADCFKANLVKVTDHCVEMKKEILNKSMSAVDYHVSKDYETYMEQVNREKWPDLSAKNDYRHILLTGGTGFLGAHLVAELLSSTNASLYLPVRGAAQENAEERFRKKMVFYFGENFYNTHKQRFTVIRADLSEHRLGMEESPYEKLVEVVDAVVHPAANVKHHGLYEELYRDNVVSTEHLLELAAAGKKADFHYVSTISVGEGNIPGREYVLFTEYCSDIGMAIDHIYLKSKFEAEKRVLAYREKGINGSIYRVGNLIFHSDSGKFQENIGDDYFYNIIKGAIKLEMVSDQMKKKMVFDMSFINYTARSIVLLSTSKGLKNQTHHLLNPYPLPMTEMALFLRELGFKLNDVKDEKEYLAKFEGNTEYEKIIELLKLHSWVFEEKEGTKPVYKIDRTIMLLKKLGLEWPKTTKELVEKMIAYCKEVDFI